VPGEARAQEKQGGGFGGGRHRMYDVSFNDQFGTFSAFYAPIHSHLLAAGGLRTS